MLNYIDYNIKFNKEQVLFNVHFVTDKVARSIIDLPTDKIVEVQTDDEDRNMQLLDMFFNSAVSDVTMRCDPYIKDVAKDDLIDEVIFSFSFPETWQSKHIAPLKEYIEKYMTYYIIAEYFEIINRDSSIYKVKARDYLSSIKDVINRRNSVVKKMPQLL